MPTGVSAGNTSETTVEIDDDDVAANTATNASISVGQSWANDNPVRGHIEEEFDEDWYRTEFTAGHCYQIDVWGKTAADEGYAQGLSLEDPFLNGVYRADGVYLPSTWNDNGRGGGRSPRHTLEFNKSGTYYVSASYSRYMGGGSFELPLLDLGTGNQHCTRVNVDDLTYEPGHFAGK